MPVARRTVVLAVITSSFAFVFLIASRFFEVSRTSGVPRFQEGLRVVLSPSTFIIEARRPFRIKALTGFDSSCARVDAKIPDQQWEQSFTRAELINGAQSELNPSRLGTFKMQFTCNGQIIGDSSLTVTIGPELGPSNTRAIRWLLTSGRPIYRDNVFFEIPILVGMEVSRGSAFVPQIASRDTHFRLQDRNGQLSKAITIVVQRNTALSDPAYLPFPVGADYRLVAFAMDGGQASSELEVSWKQMGPKLSLVVYPSTTTIYSAAISSSTVQLYLAQDARSIKPPDQTAVLLTAPPVFKSEPSDRVLLSPADPVGKYRISAATTAGNWSVGFHEPRIDATASVNVEVLPTLGFSFAALAAGLIGVLVARQRALFQQAFVAVLLELVCAAAAAFLLYGIILAGWIKSPGTEGFTLSYLASALVGLIGGYMGLAVFRLAAGIFQKLF